MVTRPVAVGPVEFIWGLPAMGVCW
jgi:hypothetical protein